MPLWPKSNTPFLRTAYGRRRTSTLGSREKFPSHLVSWRRADAREACAPSEKDPTSEVPVPRAEREEW